MQTKNYRRAAACINSVGIAYKNMNIPDSAIRAYRVAISLADSIQNDTYKGVFLQNIGVLESNKGDYPAALENYLQALEIFERKEAVGRVGQISLNIGLIYKKNLSYDKALKYYQKSLVAKLSVGDSTSITSSLQNIGNIS